MTPPSAMRIIRNARRRAKCCFRPAPAGWSIPTWCCMRRWRPIAPEQTFHFDVEWQMGEPPERARSGCWNALQERVPRPRRRRPEARRTLSGAATPSPLGEAGTGFSARPRHRPNPVHLPAPSHRQSVPSTEARVAPFRIDPAHCGKAPDRCHPASHTSLLSRLNRRKCTKRRICGTMTWPISSASNHA